MKKTPVKDVGFLYPPGPNVGKLISDEQLLFLRELLEDEGLVLTQAMRALGITHHEILYRCLKRRGVEIRYMLVAAQDSGAAQLLQEARKAE